MNEKAAATKYYAVLLKPVEGRALSLPLVQGHAQHLAALNAQGKLLLAGPFVDHPWGLLVLKGASKTEIIQILNEDPFITSGVKTFEVATWVMATRENNFMPPLSTEPSN